MLKMYSVAFPVRASEFSGHLFKSVAVRYRFRLVVMYFFFYWCAVKFSRMPPWLIGLNYDDRLWLRKTFCDLVSPAFTHVFPLQPLYRLKGEGENRNGLEGIMTDIDLLTFSDMDISFN